MPGFLDQLVEPSGEAIVVFCAVTAESAATVRRLSPNLSPEERSQAARFHFESDRIAYAQAHLLLRACLRRVTGRADRTFATGPFGKPDLDPAWGEPQLRFNLTHSRGLVACALARGPGVGVDAEAEYAQPDLLDLADRFFSLDERARLAAQLPCDRPRTFTAIWTLKEAIVKANGLGLGMGLSRFTVDPETDTVHFDQGLGEEAGRWILARRRVGEAHLAIAVRHPAGMANVEGIAWREVRPMDIATMLE